MVKLKLILLQELSGHINGAEVVKLTEGAFSLLKDTEDAFSSFGAGISGTRDGLNVGENDGGATHLIPL